MKKQINDAVFIGAGIMSATLSMLLKQLNPQIKITIYERTDEIASESSEALNNAGTGHSAFCELNYTPMKSDGSISIDKAVEIATQFQLSREFWAYLVDQGYLNNPKEIINSVPHISFVWGEKDVDFLHKRWQSLTKHPLFSAMKYSEDHEEIKTWAPLIMNGRPTDQKVAATKMDFGTDVNFGELAKQLFEKLDADIFLKHEVKDINKKGDKWHLKVKDLKTGSNKEISTDFLFIGAGGGALPLLQKAKLKEAKGYGGFPVSGKWLICNNEEIAKKHHAKVYGKAEVGAPPMSVPHLDTRNINGKTELLFGPYAGFSTKYLKQGSIMDLFRSVKFSNIVTMIGTGISNISLTKYLIVQVLQSHKQKIRTLQDYYPEAREEDWVDATAGQRVQIMVPDKKKGGLLKFGTEVVCSSDGSISSLLGASPGASTCVPIMLNLLNKCFPEEMNNEWQEKVKSMIPSYGVDFSDKAICDESRAKTSKLLQLDV